MSGGMAEVPLQVHECPMCRCGLPTCPDCGSILPDHSESPGLPLYQWCPRHPVVREVKAFEKKTGIYDPADWDPS